MSLAFPLAGAKPRISSPFGPRTHPTTGQKGKHHNGIDIPMPVGTPVLASASGTVVAVLSDNTNGIGLILYHPEEGVRTAYVHLSKRLVNKGDTVSQGQRIALSGNTGRSTGPHLHWMVYKKQGGKWKAVDPMPYVASAAELAESGFSWPSFSEFLPEFTLPSLPALPSFSDMFAPVPGTWANHTPHEARLLTNQGYVGPGPVNPGDYVLEVKTGRDWTALPKVTVEPSGEHSLEIVTGRWKWL